MLVSLVVKLVKLLEFPNHLFNVPSSASKKQAIFMIDDTVTRTRTAQLFFAVTVQSFYSEKELSCSSPSSDGPKKLNDRNIRMVKRLTENNDRYSSRKTTNKIIH